MHSLEGRAFSCFCILAAFAGSSHAQKQLSWNEVRERFELKNPNLLAGKLNIEESRANEVTAGLRPNPQLNFITDQYRIFHPSQIDLLGNAQITPTVSQLFERRRKRELRLESARYSTAIAGTDQADLVRNLLFNLRDAFTRALQQQSLLELAQQNIQYYDRVIETSRIRLQAGDISRSDFARIELQRQQFESDLINAQVNLRTAKIGLLALMNEKNPIDSFTVTGDFDFHPIAILLADVRQAALDSRPDLRSAATAVNRARTDNRLAFANGSVDPIAGLEYQRTGGFDTLGLNVTIPLRIFDRNQGEKARTAIGIHRAERSREAIETALLRDVDSGYATLQSVNDILRPYREKYLPEAVEVRDYVEFAYKNGAASLLDFLDAQKSYRDTQLNYRNLVGNYLSAVNQLNLAVGREVIP